MEVNIVQFIGYFAAIVGTVSFFPQVYRCVKTKKTDDISLNSFLLLSGGTVLWLLYGILKLNGPLIFANTLIAVSLLVILFYKLKYK